MSNSTSDNSGWEQSEFFVSGPDHREILEARWRQLTNESLPNAAAQANWPIRLNHCFQRVLLDHACGDVWYGHIDGRPAYRFASDVILRTAMEAGEACLAGEKDIAQLNRESLAFRGKLT
jgi:hypothetical protein